MMEINVWNNNFENKKINHNMQIVVVLFLTIIFIVLLTKKNLYQYIEGNGIVKENNILTIYATDDYLENITTNNKIIIGRTTFTYNVKSIEQDLEKEQNNYHKVLLEVDLKERNIVNNILKYKIIIKRKNILDSILESVRGN